MAKITIVGVPDRPGIAAAIFEPLAKAGISIDTIVQKYAPDYVALGSGFCGFDTFSEGMEDLIGVSNLIKLMAGHGYEKEAIDGILGLNWLRIYKGLL